MAQPSLGRPPRAKLWVAGGKSESAEVGMMVRKLAWPKNSRKAIRNKRQGWHGQGLECGTKLFTDKMILPGGKLTCSAHVIHSNGFDVVLIFWAVCKCSKTKQHIRCNYSLEDCFPWMDSNGLMTDVCQVIALSLVYSVYTCLKFFYFLEFPLFVGREGRDLAKINICHLYRDWQYSGMDGILLYLLKGYNIVCSFHWS